MKLGTKIKDRRKEMGYTQVALAKKANISRTYLSDVENDRYNPSLETLYDICKALDTTVEELIGGHNSYNQSQNFFNPKPIRINVYGSIPAGIPLEAVEDITDWEEIPEDWTAGGKQYIALKVTGDSMYPEYLDGDTVIILLQPDCENGDDCAVYVNGYDVTLKRVKKEPGKITLQPLNTNYAPKTYEHPGEVEILGVVKELRRKK